MRPIITPYSIKELTYDAKKAELFLRVANEVVAIHNKLIDKVKELDIIVQKSRLKGDKGDPGIDGKTPTESQLLSIIRPLVQDETSDERLLALIKPLIPSVEDGEDGIAPTKEELIALIKPLIPKAKNGKTPIAGVDYPTEDAILSLIQDEIAKIEKDEIDEDALIEKLNKHPKLKLDPRKIDGFEQTISARFNQLAARGGYLHGGGVPSLSAGVNVTLTPKSDGGYTVSASGGASGSNLAAEALVGVQAGSNVTLTFSGLAHTATTIVQIARNGQALTPTKSYSIVGVTSASVFNADAGDDFLITYAY